VATLPSDDAGDGVVEYNSSGVSGMRSDGDVDGLCGPVAPAARLLGVETSLDAGDGVGENEESGVAGRRSRGDMGGVWSPVAPRRLFEIK